jgi:hypothetical protein
MTDENSTALAHEERSLLAALLISVEPVTIETAAVRAGLSLDEARNARIVLLAAGLIRSVRGEKALLWIVEPKPDTLSEVAFHICRAYSLVAQRYQPRPIVPIAAGTQPQPQP